jgi:hypothetical protein
MPLANTDVISKNQLNRRLASASDKISRVEDVFLVYSRINWRLAARECKLKDCTGRKLPAVPREITVVLLHIRTSEVSHWLVMIREAAL